MLKTTALVPGLALLLVVTACGGNGGGDTPAGPDVEPGVDAGPVDPALYTYVLAQLNAARFAEAPAAAPLVRDAGLDTYAQTATAAFMTSGIAHGYFDTVSILPSCPAAVAPLFGDVVPGDPLAACPAAASCASSESMNFSASRAAMQPAPAEVIACR